jgi:hypothetical protein
VPHLSASLHSGRGEAWGSSKNDQASGGSSTALACP